MVPKLRSVLLALALTPCAASASAEDLHALPQYVLTTEGGGLGVFVDEVVVFSKVRTRWDGPTLFWTAERFRVDQRLGQEQTVHDWIDGRRCPALTGAIAQGAAQPPETMLAPEVEAPPPAFDVPRQRFSGPAADTKNLGGARVSWSGYGSARFRWWTDAGKTLKACWSAVPITDGDQALRPLLGGPEQVRAFKAY